MNTQAIPNMYPERTVDYSSNFAHQGIPLPLQQLAALVILLILSPFIAIVMLLISLESQEALFSSKFVLVNMVGILPCTSFAQCF